jgi:hypothetical protein
MTDAAMTADTLGRAEPNLNEPAPLATRIVFIVAVSNINSGSANL